MYVTGLICYAVYWIFQFPFLLISPQRIRYFFLVKAIIVPATWLSIFIWYAINGRMFASLASQHSKLSGTKLSWFWLSAMNSAIGSYSTLAINIADFTV
jgi:NCS1 family nucleobase:cation symporter-1